MIWFKLSNFIFPIRSKREDEIAGLDIPEMGVEAYPDFHSDRQILTAGLTSLKRRVRSQWAMGGRAWL